MWPWEHLAVGYLAYSLAVHLFGRRRPAGAAVAALALGTQFPDLVDKPLAWTFDVLPTGQTLAHSLLTALPVSALAVIAAWGLGRRRVGVAFAVGYLSHLPGDAFYPLLVGGDPSFGFLLWPLVPAVESGPSVGFVAMFRTLFARYLAELATGKVTPYLALELGLLSSVLALWLYDGLPPLRWLWSWTGGRRRPDEAPESR